MNYELAKKLKDAGFPQKGMDCNWHETESDELYFPTLSELIKACENSLFATFKDKKWHSDKLVLHL